MLSNYYNNPYIASATLNEPAQGVEDTDETSLAAAKEDKLRKLAEKKATLTADKPFTYEQADYADLTKGTYTVMPDGRKEDNSNKIYNELSPTELQAVKGLGIAKYALEPDKATGKVYMTDLEGNKQEYNGPTERLYMGKGKGPNGEDIFKLGISAPGPTPEAMIGTKWEGMDPSIVRYDSEAAKYFKLGSERKPYGWASGPEGIDTSTMQSVLLPYNVAKVMEATDHGNKSAMANRAVPGLSSEGKERFGQGYGEYYKNGVKGMFGDVNQNLSAEEYDKVMGTADKFLAERIAQQQALDPRNGIVDKAAWEKHVANKQAEYKYNTNSLADNWGNAFKGAAASAGTGVLKLVDALQEAATLPYQAATNAIGRSLDPKYKDRDIDLIKDEWVKAGEGNLDKLFGHDRALTDYASQRAKEEMEKAKIDLTSLDNLTDLATNKERLSHVGDVAGIAAYNPAVVTNSIAEVLGEGGGLKAIGSVALKTMAAVAPNLAKSVEGVLTTNRSDVIAKAKEIKSREDLTDDAKRAAIKEVEKEYTKGKLAVDLLKGSAFSNADAMVRIDNDIDKYKENNEGESPTAGKLLQIAVTDKILAEMNVLSAKSAVGLDTPVSSLSSSAITGAIKQAGAAVLHVTGSIGKEAIQETIDSIGEQVNQKYNSKEFKDATVGDIIRESSTEIALGTVLGGVGGGYMGTVGAIKNNVIGPLVGQAAPTVSAASSAEKSVKTDISQAKEQVGEEVTPAVQYFRTLAEVDKDFKSGVITKDNVVDYIDKLESMQELRYGLKDVPEGLVAYQDARYLNLANHINSFMTDENATDEQLKLQRKLPTTLPDPSTASAPTDATLGSEETTVVGATASSIYSDADRKADAERLLHFAIDSLEFTPDQADIIGSRYSRFAKANGVELERLNTIIKSYAAVEEEASIGRRSWLSYENKLDALMSATVPNTKAIERQYRQLNNWLATTNNAKLDLEEGIAAAEQLATDKNKKKISFSSSTEAFKTQYRKIGGKQFEINISYDPSTKKWVADTTQAQKLVELKQHNAEELTRVLTKYNTKASQLIGELRNEGTLIIPEAGINTSTGMSKARALDTGHIKSAMTRLSNVTGTAPGVTKVILDTQKRKNETPHSSKWDNKYDYYRVNRPLINRGEYHEGEVVLLNAMGSVVHSKSKRSISSLYLADSIAAKELGKALDARSTILLDRDYIASKTKGYKNKEGVFKVSERAGGLNSKGQQVSNYLESKGYVQVPGNPALFVHAESNKKAIEAAEESLKAAQKEAAALARDKKALVATSAQLDWLYTYRDSLDEVEQALVDIIRVAEKKYEDLRSKLESKFQPSVLEEFKHMASVEEGSVEEDTAAVEGVEFDGDVKESSTEHEDLDTALGSVAVDTRLVTAADRMNRYIERRKRELIEQADDTLSITSIDLGVETRDGVEYVKGLDASYKAMMADLKRQGKEHFQDVQEEVQEVLNKWKKYVADGYRGEELSSKIDNDLDAISDLGIAVGSVNISESLLELCMGKGKPQIYEVVMNVMGKDKEGKYTVPKGKRVRTALTQSRADELKAEFGTVVDGHAGKIVKEERLTYITTRAVSLDPNEYLTVGKNPTLLSKFAVRVFDAIDGPTQTIIKTIEKVLVKPSGVEKGDVGFEVVDKDDNSKFNIYNSPARAIIFSTAGKISPQVAAAMHLALASTIVTDKSKLVKGYKDDEAIAAMFGLNSVAAVTNRMRAIAKEHGALRKTVANSLGKEILSQLGIKAKRGDDTAIGMYEAMATDLGNTALVIAEEMGLVSSSEVASKDIAEMKKGGTSVGFTGEEVTKFVNLTSGADGKKVSVKVQKYEEAYLEYDKDIPGITTLKVGPEFSPHTDAEVGRMVSEVRNDMTHNLEIAPAARKALEGMINTKFKIDVEGAVELIELYKKGEGIKRQLGWLPLEGEEFDRLSYAKKEVQEAINRGIEKSFSSLEELIKAKNEGRNEHDHEKDINVWFRHFYATNGRYMIDSNTVNPHTDKIHRFLVQPASFRVTHDIEGTGGARKFSVIKNGKVYRTSLYVRFALAQAFGYDIDKKDPNETVEFGNMLLSLGKEQLLAIKKTITENDGKEGAAVAVVTVNGKATKLKADHISHTLQALNFLIKASGTNKVTSSLTAEYDSITNGFGNKLQQMPILGVEGFDANVMNEHFARTGVLASSLIENKEEFFTTFQGAIVGGINSMLGNDSTFKDSYQNLAVTVGEYIQTLVDKIKHEDFWKEKGKVSPGKPTSSVKVATAIFNLLPTKMDSEGKVSKELRTLFKNPFMVFNYAAGIATIRENLGEEVVMEFFEKLSKGDQEVIDAFVQMDTTITKADGTKVKITKDNSGLLVDFARNNPFNSSKLAIMDSTASTILLSVVDKLFGESVENTFKKNFGAFIEVQEATNDAFRLSFFRFETKFNEAFKEVSKKGYVTAEEEKAIVSNLWDEFPWIMGPLSEGSKDVIAVVSKAAITDPLRAGRASPSVKAIKGGKEVSISANTIMYKMVAAASAGAVIPFHYIDGAEMAKMYNSFKDGLVSEEMGILTIHDAKMAPIHHTGETGWMYNRSFHEVGRDYNLLDQLEEMTKRWKTDDMPENTTVTGLKISKGDGKEMKALLYEKAVLDLQSKIARLADANRKAREVYQANNKEGSTTKYKYQNLIGTPDQIYTPGEEKYNGDKVLDYFDGRYSTVTGIGVDSMSGVNAEPTTDIQARYAFIMHQYNSLGDKELIAYLEENFKVENIIRGCF